MATAIILFALGLALLALGGDSLVKGASGLAQRMGASPFVAGLVLVAFATSLPELAVNARAVFAGQPALALGNAVGSNIANVGLTLGAAALAAPLVVRWRALAPLLMVLLLATLAVIGFGWDGRLSPMEGGLLLAGFAGVLAFVLVRAHDERPAIIDELRAFATTRGGAGLHVVRLLVAAALLYYGAGLVVEAAPRIGMALGMESLVSGLLVVAIGTALPEMAAAVAAARRGQGDIVAGHVIGSCLFNLLVVVGGMAAVGGVQVPASFVRFELPVAFLFALLLVPLLRGDTTVSRVEGGVLLAALLAWVGLEVALLG